MMRSLITLCAVRTFAMTSAIAALSACTDAPSGPPPSLAGSPPPQSGAYFTGTHHEFSFSVDGDYYLSCIQEVTHWTGTGVVSIDVTTTSTGSVSTTIQGRFDPSTLTLTRADGTKYYVTDSGPTQQYVFGGRVTVVTLVEPLVLQSRAGDVLIGAYSFVASFDMNGQPLTVRAEDASLRCKW